MQNRDDIESFLIRTREDFREIEEGTWIVASGEGIPEIVVRHAPPVLVLRSDLRSLPSDEGAQLALCRRLLELNAVDIMHGAFGIENGEITLSDTLQLENLDFSEFRASLESLTLALTSHSESLSTD